MRRSPAELAAPAPRTQVLRGAEIAPRLEEVARLRIAVFREFPYLYDGDFDYEARYLRAYVDTPDSICVLALDGDRVVGASTGLPLADGDESFQAPFVERAIPVDEVFYCAESVVLPDYRGRGLGHRFFDAREAHARALGRFRWSAFASVDRAADDPRRPPGARDHDAFWTRRGYARQPGMTMRLAWKELGDMEESDKLLTYWLRPLEPVA